MFRGSLVALVTPFDKKGRVDRKKLAALVEWHIAEGTEGIVCSGATGEGICLQEKEKKAVAEICIRTAAKRIPILAATGVAETRMSVRYAEEMQKLGADGCMAVTPYYNKPSQKGCLLHFQEIGKAGLPLVVYHNPGRAVVRLTAETIAEISRLPGIAAIKESSGDLDHIRNVRKLCSIPILAGDDDLTFPILKEGGVGAISVIGNVFPRGWKEMIHLALAGKWKESQGLFERYLPLCKALFTEVNPQCVKFALSWLGKCGPHLRLPLIPAGEAAQRVVKSALLSLALPQFQKEKTKRV